MKKFLLTIILSLFISTIFAYDIQIDGIFYNLNNSNKTATVTNAGNMSGYEQLEIIIPEKIIHLNIEYIVNTIGERAFAGCFTFTSIKIPYTISKIEISAFRNCGHLEKIIVDPNNKYYTSINGALYNKNITTLIKSPMRKRSISIPNTVTMIGREAFESSSITSISIPNSVKYIEYKAFTWCMGLSSITIPNSVEYIGNEAFNNCRKLRIIEIGNSIKELGDKAFGGCENIISINILSKIPPIIDAETLNDIMKNTEIQVPKEAIKYYKNAKYWNTFTNFVPIE